MSEQEKSPLKDKPLRLPGQSIADERRRLIEDSLQQPALFTVCLGVLAFMEWYRYFVSSPPAPALFTVVALCSFLFVAVRYRRLKPRLRQLRLALEGEQAVGQFLERLRSRGYDVYHDVVGDGFNLDHVLIGPSGVFTIETKTWSKRDSRAEIHFDGRQLTAGGRAPDRDPIAQGKAQAVWLQRTLGESTGRTPPTWPVVVFPGWYVRNTGGGKREAWVLEPKALPSFLENEPPRLSSEDIKLFSFHLSRFIRSGEKERI